MHAAPNVTCHMHALSSATRRIAAPHRRSASHMQREHAQLGSCMYFMVYCGRADASSKTMNSVFLWREPIFYGTANATLREYSFTFDDIEGGISEELYDEDFDAVGLVAFREIGQNGEILCFYGHSYPRPFNVGKQCNVHSNSDAIKLFDYIPIEAVSSCITT
jgi:hypothetical protein